MKKMLRKRVLSVLFLTVFLSIVTAVPAFALTYNVHGYDWRSPIFDGWKNGKSYSLSPGTATLDVTSYIEYSPTETISENYTMSLMVRTWYGYGSSLGGRTLRASQAGGRNIVSWKVTEASDRYYLYGDKVEENNTLEFEGTLSN